MLAIYNESKTNWVRATINDKTSKITTSRTLNDGKVRYLDVLIDTEIETPGIVESVDMSEKTVCSTLYNGNTSIKFKSKDLKPFIAKSEKFNNDILFINISLKGKLIKSMSNEHSILAYLIAQGELFLIVSLNEKAEKPAFEVVLHDPHVVADTTYVFEKVDGKYTVSTDMVQTDTVISKPTFKLNRFRPARPTNLVFANESHEEFLTKVLKYPESHKIVYFTDGDVEDMVKHVEGYKKSGYKAATLYVDSERFDGSDDKWYGKEYDTIKSNFKYVNILLSNGKVLRK